MQKQPTLTSTNQERHKQDTLWTMIWTCTINEVFWIFGSKYYIKRDDDISKFDRRSDEGMFLGYSLKRKAYKYYKYRTKTIVECTNVRIDEKFGTKETMVDYNSDEEESNPRIVRQNVEVFLKISMTCI